MARDRLRLLLWLLVGGLCVFGMIMVASVTGSMGAAESFNAHFLIKQGAALLVGLGAAVLLSWCGTTWLTRGSCVMLVTLGALGLLVLVPIIGDEVKGAKRWIDLGVIKIQPSELAKIALIFTTAWYYSDVVKEKIKLHWQGVIVPLAIFAVFAVLIYRTRDLGTIVVMAGVLWTMIFFAGARWFYVSMVGILLAPLVTYMAIFQEAYRRERFIAFWDPWHSDSPAAYHLKQSLIAIGSGGVDGQGLGEGLARGQWLPERHTDFIYAVICQEFGFIGAVAVIVAFSLLTVCGLMIANATRDRHQRLLAVGATMLIAIQAFWNMAVVVGCAPTKGLTLPFISYGGSSMVVCLLAVGLLDAVVRHAHAPMAVPESQPRQLGVLTTRTPRAARVS